MPSSADHRKKQRTAGFCSSCLHRKAEDGIKLCRICRPKCAKHALNSVRRKIAKGLCVKCSSPRDTENKTFCGSCVELRKTEYRARVEAGICPVCMSPATIGQQCEKHWYLSIVRGFGMKASDVAMLKRLWEKQGGRCALTGDVLVKGANASIDHKIPRSKGGGNDESNLQWVTLDANRLKWDRTHSELLLICEKVLRHAGAFVSLAIPSQDFDAASLPETN